MESLNDLIWVPEDENIIEVIEDPLKAEVCLVSCNHTSFSGCSSSGGEPPILWVGKNCGSV